MLQVQRCPSHTHDEFRGACGVSGFISLYVSGKSMKTVLYAGIFLVLAILICGCTTTPPQEGTHPPEPKIPSLVGNWSGTMTGYTEGLGFTDYTGKQITMRVIEQKDRIFAGEFVYTNVSWEPTSFTGAINHDGMTLTIVEKDGGYSYGTFIQPDEIDLVYADNAEPYEIAIDTLRKD